MTDTKRALITAGPISAPLDANKLVSNRTRGIWAVLFARYLAVSDRDGDWNRVESRPHHDVTLLIPESVKQAAFAVGAIKDILSAGGKVIVHNGFDQYKSYCEQLAPQVDAAVMASAVTNYIPKYPWPDKMPTDVEEIAIPFIRAPRVIDQMKVWNPSLTLIGCKMTIGATPEETDHAAYKVLRDAKCNTVVCNDQRNGLDTKWLLFSDGARIDVSRNRSTREDLQFFEFYRALQDVIWDEHYRSRVAGDSKEAVDLRKEWALFNKLVDLYRERFKARLDNQTKVFGALAVRCHNNTTMLSPREKGVSFSAADAVYVERCDHQKRELHVRYGKATLNAPLLIRMLDQYPKAAAIVHLHELTGVSLTVPYAPPGTVRDSMRGLLAPSFHVRGHGVFMAVDENGNPIQG